MTDLEVLTKLRDDELVILCCNTGEIGDNEKEINTLIQKPASVG